MNLKKYLLAMSILSLVSWAIFIFLINTINPESSDYLGFFIFYYSFFVALSSSLIILSFLIKKKFNIGSNKKSFRQSLLISILITAILFMLAESLFSWLNIGLLILILSIIEYSLINNK